MKLPSWLKIGLAGMLGCLAGTTLVWHYTHQWWAIIVAFPTSFLVGWIACAPGSFFAAFPCAWQEVRGWRPAPGARNRFELGLVFATVLWQLAILLLLAGGCSVYNRTTCLVFAVLAVSWALLILFFFTTIALFSSEQVGSQKEAWRFLRRYNLLTLPFFLVYWVCLGLLSALRWFVVEVVPRIPGAIKALALFLPRLLRAWARLTASNLRLTSGSAAVLGLFACLWQNWPPVPGCLAGLVSGIALWGSARLALRYLPEPQRQMAQA